MPKSEKLDQILLAFNQLKKVGNLERAPNLSVLDLHNNKLDNLPESILTVPPEDPKDFKQQLE